MIHQNSYCVIASNANVVIVIGIILGVNSSQHCVLTRHDAIQILYFRQQSDELARIIYQVYQYFQVWFEHESVKQMLPLQHLPWNNNNNIPHEENRSMHSKRSNCSVSLHSGEYTVCLFIFTSSSFVFVYISCLCFCDVLCFIQTPAQWKYVLGAVFLRTKKNVYPGLRLLAVYTNPLEGVVQNFFDNLKYVTGACFIYVSFLVSPLFTFFSTISNIYGGTFLMRAISRESTRGRSVHFFDFFQMCYWETLSCTCNFS